MDWHSKTLQWLEEHWGEHMLCPGCGSTDFGVAQEPVQLLHAFDVSKSHGAAMVVCNTCGRIELVSLKTVAGGGE